MQNNTISGLFIGQNLISLKSVDSTNNYLKNQLAKSKPLPEGTVILAEDQFAGRGQFENKWLSQPGKNLTFSILLFPVFLAPLKQFLLNIAVSLAINDTITSFIGCDCKIKWPNDIYFKDKKIGGVLIENILQGSKWKYAIVGIGINVNQLQFDDRIKNITSLSAIIGKELALDTLLSALSSSINNRYNQLKGNDFENHIEEYKKNLYRYQSMHAYESNGIPFEGRITNIKPEGQLEITVGDEVKSFSLKEVKYL
ncbi:Biotin-protein ligase [Arcticibacter svalbardensis MN12-7]|uniref:Biotin-protein ligase n=1 Tax=Arcticibacter svalbardensis MN12-7 TaxID=1150600 RepID=R9H0H2_9SPHI|nr:biotin--[acetyl-CoA-carboxylase] ligase [Arcticibacter svalbardensis]EOR94704.1 Biotin-protein ligase [Arcticibacter svalbardensis MN12-7]